MERPTASTIAFICLILPLVILLIAKRLYDFSDLVFYAIAIPIELLVYYLINKFTKDKV